MIAAYISITNQKHFFRLLLRLLLSPSWFLCSIRITPHSTPELLIICSQLLLRRPTASGWLVFQELKSERTKSSPSTPREQEARGSWTWPSWAPPGRWCHAWYRLSPAERAAWPSSFLGRRASMLWTWPMMETQCLGVPSRWTPLCHQIPQRSASFGSCELFSTATCSVWHGCLDNCFLLEVTLSGWQVISLRSECAETPSGVSGSSLWLLSLSGLGLR